MPHQVSTVDELRELLPLRTGVDLDDGAPPAAVDLTPRGTAASDFERPTLVRRLGRGSYGTVWSAESSSDPPEKLAVKIISMPVGSEAERVKAEMLKQQKEEFLASKAAKAELMQKSKLTEPRATPASRSAGSSSPPPAPPRPPRRARARAAAARRPRRSCSSPPPPVTYTHLTLPTKAKV